MLPSTLGMFVLASLAMLLIPGPAVLYIVGRSLQQGRKAGLLSVLGIVTGTLVHVVAAALGLSALLLTSSLAFSIVKYTGAAYLIYLGVRTILRPDDEPSSESSGSQSLKRIYSQGVVVNILNPKTALFFFAFLPQFVDPSQGSVGRQVLALGILFACLSFVTDSGYAVLAGTLGRQFRARPRLWRKQKYVTGGILITLGLSAGFATSGKNG